MALLNTTCDIERPTSTVAGNGMPKAPNFDTPITVATDLQCSIQPADGSEMYDFERRNISVDTFVYFTDTTVVAQIGDRVVDNNYSPSRYYKIVSQCDMAGRGRFFLLHCLRTG